LSKGSVATRLPFDDRRRVFLIRVKSLLVVFWTLSPITLLSSFPTITVVFRHAAAHGLTSALSECNPLSVVPRSNLLEVGQMEGIFLSEPDRPNRPDRQRSLPLETPAGAGAPAQRASATSVNGATSRSGTGQPKGVGQTPADTHQRYVRQRAQYGGFKFGSAFFGWLTATGTAVILTALVVAFGAAVGLGSRVDELTDANPSAADTTMGWVGAVALLIVLFLSYFAGGYVAGRMARFDGARQGFAVWLWAIIIAVAVAVVSLLAGSQFNVLAKLNSFPRIPVNEGDLTAATAITAVLLAIVSLVGAVLGGLAGMRFHRRVDRVPISDQ
jgi:hypothetical protein